MHTADILPDSRTDIDSLHVGTSPLPATSKRMGRDMHCQSAELPFVISELVYTQSMVLHSRLRITHFSGRLGQQTAAPRAAHGLITP
jgi:hypothetical protein